MTWLKCLRYLPLLASEIHCTSKEIFHSKIIKKLYIHGKSYRDLLMFPKFFNTITHKCFINIGSPRFDNYLGSCACFVYQNLNLLVLQVTCRLYSSIENSLIPKGFYCFCNECTAVKKIKKSSP